MSSARRLSFSFLIALIIMNVACQKACGKKTEALKEEKQHVNVETKTESEKSITAFFGLDLSELKSSQRENLIKFLNDEICPCDCPKTFAQCLAIENGCEPGLILARWTVQQIKKDTLPESRLFPHVVQEIAGFLAKPVKIDTAQAHRKGTENAPFTIVEFADFECRACQVAAAEIKKFVENNKDVQVYFMHFPLLPAHQNAERAAVAAEAAGKLGKFWEMHDLLFANNGSLTDDAIKNLAKKIFNSEQLVQFEKSLSDPALLARVNSQRDYARNVLKLEGTPTFFFNGRPYNLSLATEGYELRLAMEKARNDMACGAKSGG